MNASQTFAIQLNRLPRIDDTPGLILLSVETQSGSGPATRIGALTDAALRGRLAHFGLHSANEVAAIRHALSSEEGRATVYENWPGLESCLQFWYGFVGSRIQILAWTCEACGKQGRENIGGSVGESFLRRCACGRSNRITVPKTLAS
jgi:hypothetical protein